jgi:hypothetical protein
MSDAQSMLTPWSNFYIMAGSSAGALTGLMFVVITLVTGLEKRSRQDGLSTFSTPTVVHFCAALFASATLVAPWPSVTGPAVLLGLAGIGGAGYALRLMYRTKRLTAYSADVEDWTWYTILPFVAYGALLAGAIALPAFTAKALFAIAGAVLFLIFIGIRNAWDTVTYIAVRSDDEAPPASQPEAHPAPAVPQGSQSTHTQHPVDS